MRKLLGILMMLVSVVAAAQVGTAVKPEFADVRIRGVDKIHWDQPSTGIQLSGANAIRFGLNFARPAADNLALVQAATKPNGLVPIVGNWAATCSSDPAALAAVVDTWIDQAPAWTQLHGFINIANEWGAPYLYQQQVKPWAQLPQHGWRDAYVAQIARMRKAGYTSTLMIDAGSCGQDWQTIVNDGPAVLAADPLRNVVFDLHIYGGLNTAAKLDTAFAALVASKLPIVIGEFGPGNNIGPSPTPVAAVDIVARAEAAGFGWLAWAWDDNDLAGCASDDKWFSMTTHCSAYTGQTSELTAFGQVIVPLLHKLNAR